MEREALIAALERMLAREGGAPQLPHAYLSEWRRAGLEENVEGRSEREPR